MNVQCENRWTWVFVLAFISLWRIRIYDGIFLEKSMFLLFLSRPTSFPCSFQQPQPPLHSQSCSHAHAAKWKLPCSSGDRQTPMKSTLKQLDQEGLPWVNAYLECDMLLAMALFFLPFPRFFASHFMKIILLLNCACGSKMKDTFLRVFFFYKTSVFSWNTQNLSPVTRAHAIERPYGGSSETNTYTENYWPFVVSTLKVLTHMQMKLNYDTVVAYGWTFNY